MRRNPLAVSLFASLLLAMPLAHALDAAPRIAQNAIIVDTHIDAPGILIAQLNGSAAGQSVFHIHFHVVPRHEGLDLRFHARDMADHKLLAEHAARVRAALD